MCALEEECLKRKMVRNGLLGYEQGMHKQNYEKKKKRIKNILHRKEYKIFGLY